MYSIYDMNDEKIDILASKIQSIEENIAALKELLMDYKACESLISKRLLLSAIKKYGSTISDFNVEKVLADNDNERI